MHTLVIPDLNDLEAEHVAEILHGYKSDTLEKKLEAMSRNDVNAVNWYDAHLAWHEDIMKKIAWTKVGSTAK